MYPALIRVGSVQFYDAPYQRHKQSSDKQKAKCVNKSFEAKVERAGQDVGAGNSEKSPVDSNQTCRCQQAEESEENRKVRPATWVLRNARLQQNIMGNSAGSTGPPSCEMTEAKARQTQAQAYDECSCKQDKKQI